MILLVVERGKELPLQQSDLFIHNTINENHGGMYEAKHGGELFAVLNLNNNRLCELYHDHDIMNIIKKTSILFQKIHVHLKQRGVSYCFWMRL